MALIYASASHAFVLGLLCASASSRGVATWAGKPQALRLSGHVVPTQHCQRDQPEMANYAMPRGCSMRLGLSLQPRL